VQLAQVPPPFAPSLQPWAPSLQPWAPNLQPCVCSLQPYVPSLQPNLCSLQPWVSILRLCVCSLQPWFPALQAAALQPCGLACAACSPVHPACGPACAGGAHAFLVRPLPGAAAAAAPLRRIPRGDRRAHVHPRHHEHRAWTLSLPTPCHAPSLNTEHATLRVQVHEHREHRADAWHEAARRVGGRAGSRGGGRPMQSVEERRCTEV